MRQFLTLTVLILLTVPGVVAAQFADLQPRPVTLRGSMSLPVALASVERQTGNTIVDQRMQKSEDQIKLDLNKVSFWQALDAIARTANVAFSPYRAEGAVAVIDGPYRSVPVSYNGLFRVAVKGTTVHNDLESDTRTCTANLEIAWEPRFQPFYLDVGAAAVVFAADGTGKKMHATIAAQGKQPVTQRGAVEIPVLMSAPQRTSARIESFTGKLSFVGPTRMLVFTFNDLKPTGLPVQEKEGVTVQMARIVVTADRWSVDVNIQNPPGGPEFESFQSWLQNNEIRLEKGKGGEDLIWKPSGEEHRVSSDRAAATYHFLHRGRTPELIGKLGDWRIAYQTPARIVEVEATYAFKDVPLP